MRIINDCDDAWVREKSIHNLWIVRLCKRTYTIYEYIYIYIHSVMLSYKATAAHFTLLNQTHIMRSWEAHARGGEIAGAMSMRECAHICWSIECGKLNEREMKLTWCAIARNARNIYERSCGYIFGFGSHIVSMMRSDRVMSSKATRYFAAFYVEHQFDQSEQINEEGQLVLINIYLHTTYDWRNICQVETWNPFLVTVVLLLTHDDAQMKI